MNGAEIAPLPEWNTSIISRTGSALDLSEDAVPEKNRLERHRRRRRHLLYSVGPWPVSTSPKGFSTPLANAEYQKFFATFGGRPVHKSWATTGLGPSSCCTAPRKSASWPSDPEITGDDARRQLGEVTGEGVGIIEAPRGTLIHHYNTDDKGIVTDANIVVATTHNKGPINLAVRKAAKHFIKDGNVDEGILNHMEMAYSPYDLCLGCATHAITPGSSPMKVEIFNSKKEKIQTLKNY